MLTTTKAPRFWHAVHGHAEGTTTYTVKSKKKPTPSAVIKACQINFDKHREETIRIFPLEPMVLDADMDVMDDAKIQKLLDTLFSPPRKKPSPAACDGTVHNPKMKFNPRRRKLSRKTQARIAAGVKKYIK